MNTTSTLQPWEKDANYQGVQLVSQRSVELIQRMVKEPRTLAVLKEHTHYPMVARWARAADKPDWCRLWNEGKPVSWHNNAKGGAL